LELRFPQRWRWSVLSSRFNMTQLAVLVCLVDCTIFWKHYILASYCVWNDLLSFRHHNVLTTTCFEPFVLAIITVYTAFLTFAVYSSLLVLPTLASVYIMGAFVLETMPLSEMVEIHCNYSFRSHQSLSYSRTSQHFMEPEGSLPCSQELTTGHYSELGESSPQTPVLFI
jgi:hypothetical protein